ncbi:PREDICTED: probable inactive ribonuclease-like protein 13 [Condylura cristata]|uniref:probable inactive ribonuclease-like protein 13 n=1 Tax=Condylura cristata TaxID=143302 RepID=UPI0003345E19|nr:PREDICTED: probable inactive ribonuclease-like protein 13 [Condylura cristata]
MTPVVVWILSLQFLLEPAVIVGSHERNPVNTFRDLNIDYPRVKNIEEFHSYCNILMSYVRGKKQSWFCPKVHYWIHAPWKVIKGLCRHSDNFCESYNEFCTFTRESFPVTTCTVAFKEQPTSCNYNTSLSNQRLCLLCSAKYEAKPIGIFGTF